jgi:LPS O-antigen subunit length determinant protein (WzzB/FepE family)
MEMSEISELSKRPADAYEDDEIDLRELFAVLWEGKIWIGATTVAAAIISVVFALKSTQRLQV